MAKALVVARRRGDLTGADVDGLRRACRAVTPDNLAAPPDPWLSARGGIGLAVMNPGAGCRLSEDGIALGYQPADPCSGAADWWHVSIEVNAGRVRARTDVLGTRSVWYFKDDDVFVASTSQFMILSFIGSFEFERATIPWIFSSGTLGPGLSWDRRIARMEADSHSRRGPCNVDGPP